ncbi:hypothetical protein BDV36DRAFT_248603 [Aspergillus pseudocaelatus]|uniref:HNH nuclease domain-containing protein n=1 Tax=Aspergillus pseudocaelatus TaxID=1825620 RepID=A0ABQ6WZ35_9EURO|nr:hypothetical protein BDV36DRAFT_248603 [Aspergillus pseudocaelatus]
MLWLSDLDFLRKRVEIIESAEEIRPMAKASLNNVQPSKDAIKAWLARRSKGNDSTRIEEQPGEPTEPTEPTPTHVASQKTSRKRKSKGKSSSPRSIPRPKTSGSRSKRLKSVKDTASERDNGCCVITKMGEPIQICHIYPYPLGAKAESERESFWSHLEIFWPPETIARWKKDIMGPDSTEVPQNLLCLSTIVHELWGSARLAF